ncbi:membrane protein [Microtetraspora sp. NBRC 13810]|uniref:helix-turn-helix domain-containing protein n=1 Tax=Microtetraspora sp. NBRC 13810 TaxID=3030990 RepID=UPI0024A2EC77|nr:helix-turn-helix domain-containing protein [Microtetraspora sp. NBRC 13810]GLW08519.1 membrane protein [Microtetraspora sp. NBRC 13810]
MNVRSEGIGATLAEARRAAGLTVSQLSARTRIREALIYAIERDDLSQCGGDFYARGHVRNIAKAVGLDPDATVARYDEIQGGVPGPVRAAKVFQADNPIKLRERRSPNWSMALLVALAIVVIFGIVRVMGGEGERSADVRQRPGAPSAGQSAPPRPAAAAPAGQASMVEVSVRTTAPSWLRVVDAKGRRLFTGTLPAGKTSTWKARDKVRIVIGNAGGVTLKVNGKDLGVPGAPGETVRRSFGPGAPKPR